jgi:hypothetical protein
MVETKSSFDSNLGYLTLRPMKNLLSRLSIDTVLSAPVSRRLPFQSSVVLKVPTLVYSLRLFLVSDTFSCNRIVAQLSVTHTPPSLITAC